MVLLPGSYLHFAFVFVIECAFLLAYSFAFGAGAGICTAGFYNLLIPPVHFWAVPQILTARKEKMNPHPYTSGWVQKLVPPQKRKWIHTRTVSTITGNMYRPKRRIAPGARTNLGSSRNSYRPR